MPQALHFCEASRIPVQLQPESNWTKKRLVKICWKNSDHKEFLITLHGIVINPKSSSSLGADMLSVVCTRRKTPAAIKTRGCYMTEASQVKLVSICICTQSDSIFHCIHSGLALNSGFLSFIRVFLYFFGDLVHRFNGDAIEQLHRNYGAADAASPTTKSTSTKSEGSSTAAWT